MARDTTAAEDLFLPVTDSYGLYASGASCLYRGCSPYQAIEVYDTPAFGRILCIDGYAMTSEKDESFYHEALVHIPAISHPRPRRALIVGGGDGGAAEELLKHPSIERVVLVEIDVQVIETARQHLASIHRGSLDDPRVEIIVADGLQYVTSTPTRFDLLILDLTDPMGPSRPLYSTEFYRACRRILNDGGIMSLHVESPICQPAAWCDIIDALRTAFPIVAPYVVSVLTYGALWGMATASATLDPRRVSGADVDARIRQRGLTGLEFYDAETHSAVFALPGAARQLLA
jgi:spermidine synthase